MPCLADTGYRRNDVRVAGAAGEYRCHLESAGQDMTQDLEQGPTLLDGFLKDESG